MSVPLDRLYYYIERVAEDIRGDSVIIYRFFPHGSKKVEDLDHTNPYPWLEHTISPAVYCNDQEPLDYYRYCRSNIPEPLVEVFTEHNIDFPFDFNFRRGFHNIYDQAIVLHSEKRSKNVDLYAQNNFIPVYYWSHAIIALDWFRYAEYIQQRKDIKKTFLVYNRAWSGTREYRLKFADLLIQLDLVNISQMNCSPIDIELNKHYDLHKFTNDVWRPRNVIEKYFPIGNATSNYSADFDIEDYEGTDIEVVLETLFDDTRLHLTEKTLRPIALGQPFILAGTQGSLEYLRSYGFKTFGHIWDERYDQETDSQYRLHAIADLMKQISQWAPWVRERKMSQARTIAAYNRQHFFSGQFQKLISDELKENLANGLEEIEIRNTSKRYFDVRKFMAKHSALRSFILEPTEHISKHDLMLAIQHARKYYLRRLSL